MSAPVKPWEKSKIPGDLLSTSRSIDDPTMNSNLVNNLGLYSNLPMQVAPGAPTGAVRRVSRTRPAPPPALGAMRPNQGYGAASYGGYGNMGTMGMNSYTGGYGASGYGYGSTGYGSYGGYGGTGYGGTMGGYGGYGSSYGRMGAMGGMGGMGGYGMNRYNQPPPSSLENRFIQMAEESSRPAFESIESLVQTFGSVSFMMESTFGALYSSFRAVLGVAENFGRLRTLFGQVFSTFAVLRFFQWAYRKLLYYLGMRADNPAREAIWQQAAGSGLPDAASPEARRTMWPVALFLAIVCSGPYLMWKLLSSISVPPPEATQAVPMQGVKAWLTSSKPMYMAVVQYDFEARTEQEMSVQANQQLYVAPSDFQTAGRDWLLAGDKSGVGFVPRNFVTVRGPLKLQYKTPANPGTKSASTFDQPLQPEPFHTEPVMPQANRIENIDVENTQFPLLEQFQPPPSAPAFQPEDFEPKIVPSNEKVPGQELP